jgi:ribonuclease D
VKRFRAAIAKLEALPPESWPEKMIVKRRKRDREFDQRIDSLLKLREQAAKRYDLEGSLIAPRAALESLAAGEFTPDELLMTWQRECLGI